MENDQSDLDNEHFEDDLSYMYDLDGDHHDHTSSHASYTTNRRSIFTDVEEGVETKALLMKVNNKFMLQEKKNEENEEKFKRLEEAIFQLTNRSTYHTSSFSNRRSMNGLDDETIRNSNNTSVLNSRPMEVFLEDDIVSEEDKDDIVMPGFSNVSHKVSKSITNKGKEYPELSTSIMRSSVDAKQKSANIVMGFNSLSQDTYNLMMLSNGFFHRDWQLGFVVFLFQLGLGLLTLYSQLVSSESDFNDTILQIPIHTKTQVKMLQISSIFISVYYQDDVFNGIALPIDLRLSGPHPWGGIPIEEDEKNSRAAWIFRVLIPNLLMCIQGFTVFLAS